MFVKDHPFIKDIPADETGERPYKLEGFLFPDTYDIYEDASEETIIDKMLDRFEQIFGEVYTARAKELGMSMYDVVTLASVIEKEARVSDDFYRVSAVFSNRMKANMNLDSDATLEYVLKRFASSDRRAACNTVRLQHTHKFRASARTCFQSGRYCNQGCTLSQLGIHCG